jgi:formylglycine-generating enzyme required for sulfatase activity
MKAQILFSVLLLSFFFSAFIPKHPKIKDDSGFSIKEIDKSVVKITDSLYAGKYEVSNLMYHYWGYDICKNNQTELMTIHLPDTLNWRDASAYNEPLVEYYFRHPAYQDYPIVNITYDAAVKYCEWLTEKYNADPKRQFKKVLFRLPTQKEWETASKGGIDLSVYAWGNSLLQNGKFMCNYKVVGDEFVKYDSLSGKLIIDSGYNSFGVAGSLNDAADIPAPVASYEPNNLGLYNVCGNAAEMVSEKGISRGGGWKSPGGDVKIASAGTYTKSANDLGFRYFMQIIEK